MISSLLIAGTWLRLRGGQALEALANNEYSIQLYGSPNPTMSVIATALVGLVCAGTIALLRYGGAPPSRVLLVVDDVDRCKPEHLLSVMESIKLLIEDEGISQRVQVAMLLEEDILRHAIFVKYGALADEQAKLVLRSPYNIERLMRENGEKLFTAHLRLPSLGSAEVRDLVESFSHRRARMIQRREEVQAKRSALQERLYGDSPGIIRGETVGEVSSLTKQDGRVPIIDHVGETVTEPEQLMKARHDGMAESRRSVEELDRELESIAKHLTPNPCSCVPTRRIWHR